MAYIQVRQPNGVLKNVKVPPRPRVDQLTPSGSIVPGTVKVYNSRGQLVPAPRPRIFTPNGQVFVRAPNGALVPSLPRPRVSVPTPPKGTNAQAPKLEVYNSHGQLVAAPSPPRPKPRSAAPTVSVFQKAEQTRLANQKLAAAKAAGKPLPVRTAAPTKAPVPRDIWEVLRPVPTAQPKSPTNSVPAIKAKPKPNPNPNPKPAPATPTTAAKAKPAPSSGGSAPASGPGPSGSGASSSGGSSARPTRARSPTEISFTITGISLAIAQGRQDQLLGAFAAALSLPATALTGLTLATAAAQRRLQSAPIVMDVKGSFSATPLTSSYTFPSADVISSSFASSFFSATGIQVTATVSVGASPSRSNDDTAPSSAPKMSAASASGAAASDSNTQMPVIIGAVVGGAALFGLLLGGFYYVTKVRKDKLDGFDGRASAVVEMQGIYSMGGGGGGGGDGSVRASRYSRGSAGFVENLYDNQGRRSGSFMMHNSTADVSRPSLAGRRSILTPAASAFSPLQPPSSERRKSLSPPPQRPSFAAGSQLARPSQSSSRSPPPYPRPSVGGGGMY